MEWTTDAGNTAARAFDARLDLPELPSKVLPGRFRWKIRAWWKIRGIMIHRNFRGTRIFHYLWTRWPHTLLGPLRAH